jgi:hypothetical protein
MTQTSSAIIVTVKSSMEYGELCMSMRLDNACYFGNSERDLAAAGHRPTGAASGRGIVNPARCLVTVYRWVSVNGRAASSARSAGRAICDRTAMARSGPAPGVTSSCRAVKAASWPRGPQPTWDGERRRPTRGGRAQGRPASAGGCRLGPRIVTNLVAPLSQLPKRD